MVTVSVKLNICVLKMSYLSWSILSNFDVEEDTEESLFATFFGVESELLSITFERTMSSDIFRDIVQTGLLISVTFHFSNHRKWTVLKCFHLSHWHFKMHKC